MLGARALAGVVAVAVASAVFVGVPQAEATHKPVAGKNLHKGVTLKADRTVPGKPWQPTATAKPAVLAPAGPARTPAATFPAAAAVDVDLSSTATVRSAVGSGTSTAQPLVAAPGTGIQLGQGDDTAPANRTSVTTGTTTPAPTKATKVHVTVMNHATAVAAGITGEILTVARADGGTTAAPVKIAVSYAGFASAYGGDFATRLQLVSLPACALTTPKLAACQQRTPLSSTNDAKTQQLSATVKAPPASSQIVIAANSAPAGSTSNYQATSLAASNSWTAGGNSGSFTYSYPFTVQGALGTAGPGVVLGYDSSSVDGKTTVENGQASAVGDGWDYAPGFIERSYQPCSKAVTGSTSTDLCFGSNWTAALSLSFGAHGGQVVHADGDTTNTHFKLANDDGTTIDLIGGAGNGTVASTTAAGAGEFFRIRTPDGMVYYFGADKLPAEQGGTNSDQAQATQSTWYEPVFNNPATTACKNPATASASACETAWRWNLDFAVDTHTNVVRYSYGREANDYGTGTAKTPTPYIRGGYLKQIDYGFQTADVIATRQPAAQVVFTNSNRCLDAGTPYSTDPSGGDHGAAPSGMACSNPGPDPGPNPDNNTITTANAPYFYDTPTDQLCRNAQLGGTATTCSATSPTFWSDRMLSAVTTRVRVNGSFTPVDHYDLFHQFNPMADSDPLNNRRSLWLAAIRHCGGIDVGATCQSNNPAATEPDVLFNPVPLPNRVPGNTDPNAAGLPTFQRQRMQSINDELNATTVVTYNTTPCTAPPTGPADWHNTASCYPEYWTPPNQTNPITDWFDKYTVNSVTVTDGSNSGSHGANQVVTHYTYDTATGAAWHSNDSELVTTAAARTYDQFRGFHQVTVTTGSGTDSPTTKTVTTYLRGMDQDPDLVAVNAGKCANSVDCPAVIIPDSRGGSTTDDNAYTGRVLETATVNTQTGSTWSDVVTRPWESTAQATHVRPGFLPALRSRQLGTAVTISQVPIVGNGTGTATGTRTTEVDTFHDVGGGGRVVATDTQTPVYSGATPAVPDTTPETCTLTSYATNTNPARVMLTFPDITKAWSAPCFTVRANPYDPTGSLGTGIWTAVNATNLVAYTETRYDDDGTANHDYPGYLTLGEPRVTAIGDTFTSGSIHALKKTSTAFDGYGRAISDSTLDAAGNPLSTTTNTFTAGTGEVPTRISVQGPMAGWNPAVTVLNTRGQVLDVTDPNGRRTDEQYDALGRVTKVWTPDHTLAQYPATPVKTFEYGVNGNNGGNSSAPSWTETDTLREDNSTYIKAVSLYDSLGRIRQTQTIPPDGSPGRTIVDTFYDSLGHTTGTDGPYYEATTTPSSSMWTGTVETYIDKESRAVYDGLGRAVKSQTFTQGNVTPLWESNVAYPGADRTDTTPATSASLTPSTGGTRTSAFTDARGLTAALYTYHPGTAFGDGNLAHTDILTYGYDNAGRQNQVKQNVDATHANTWTTSYNLLGQKTQTTDPDAGTTLYQKTDGTAGYDISGNLTDVQTGAGQRLHYKYDLLGRKTFEWSGAAETDSALMAAWTYDSQVKGQPDGSTRYIGGKTGSLYSTSINGYDAAYRPLGTTVTIPPAEGALAGLYTTTNGYTPITGMLDHVDLPIGGGLQADTVGYGYNANGLLITSGDNFATHLSDSAYTTLGQLQQTVLGDYPNTVTTTTNYDPATGRVRNVNTAINGWAGPVSNTSYLYNPAGQITATQTTQSTANGWISVGTPPAQIVNVTTQTDLQCYTYDYAGRLTQAWTDTGGVTFGAATPTNPTGAHPGAVDACTSNSATPATWKIGGGPAPYGQTFTYDQATGNRQTETDYNAAGTVTATHTSNYPAAGTTGPHTLTSVNNTVGTTNTTDSYSYDTGGNTHTRTVNSAATPLNETLTWGPEGTLDKNTDAAGNTADFIYSADGTQLIRHDKTGGTTTATLYLGNTELHLAAGSVTGQRYFAYAGAPTIVENGGAAPKITYEVSNSQGTANTTIDAATAYSLTGITNHRYTTPFNTPRGTTTIAPWTDDHTFLGKTTDTTTGLVDVGARKYDPATGRFISIDPVFQPNNPRAIGGYAYSNNDPVSSSDPSGLCTDSGSCHQPATPTPAVTAATTAAAAASAAAIAAQGVEDNAGFVVEPGSTDPSAPKLSFADATKVLTKYYNDDPYANRFNFGDANTFLAEVYVEINGTVQLRIVAFISKKGLRGQRLSGLDAELRAGGVEVITAKPTMGSLGAGHSEGMMAVLRNSIDLQRAVLKGVITRVGNMLSTNRICSPECAGDATLFKGDSDVAFSEGDYAIIDGVIKNLGTSGGNGRTFTNIASEVAGNGDPGTSTAGLSGAADVLGGVAGGLGMIGGLIQFESGDVCGMPAFKDTPSCNPAPWS